jgi:hypothetical protein
VWVHELPASPERILAALASDGRSTAPETPGEPVAPGTLVGQTGHTAREHDAGPTAGTPVPPADTHANEQAPQEGLDPRPDAPTDPEPFRGPTDPPQRWGKDRDE